MKKASQKFSAVITLTEITCDRKERVPANGKNFIRETFCGKIPLFITYQMSYYYQVFSVSLSPLFLFPVILIIKLKKKRKISLSEG